MNEIENSKLIQMLISIRKLEHEALLIEDYCRINGLPFSRHIVIEIQKTLKSYEKGFSK